jgi:hypothetical protein
MTAYTVSYDRPDSEEFDNPYVAPFFIGQCDGAEVTNLRMSAGEQWVHFLLWFLDKNANGLLILIDEPETFISPRGHRHLMDEIARRAIKNEQQIIVATHSTEVLSRFPLQNIRMCLPTTSGSRITTPTSVSQMHEVIGVETQIKLILPTEDRLAVDVLTNIIQRYSTLSRQAEILDCGGEGSAIATARGLKYSHRFQAIAVLDADQRGTGYNDALFLPGTMNPEDELLNHARSQVQALALRLSRTTVDIEVALSGLDDLDHQYKIREVARVLGHPEAAVVASLISLWLEEPAISTQAQGLAETIEGATSR